MFNLTGSEIMFLLIIGLVVLGPEKLPDAIRRVGRLYGELKRMSSGVQSDLRKVMDEPVKEMVKTTNSMKSLFTDTANEFQSAAKDVVTPTFIPYGATTNGQTTPPKSNEVPVVLYQASEEEIAQSEPSDADDEITEAISRAAEIAAQRTQAKPEADAASVHVLDDIS